MSSDAIASTNAIPESPPRGVGPRAFDPMRAHGAWIFLSASVGAGALAGSGNAVERGMLVGTGVAGGFMLASAMHVGIQHKRRHAFVGGILTAAMPAVALALDPSTLFLVPIALAIVMAMAAIFAGRSLGFLSRTTVALGTAAIVTAAPVTAVAAGASLTRAFLLYGIMVVFCCWRSLQVLSDLGSGHDWTKVRLRSRGLREAAATAVWSIMAVVITRLCA
jgi:hypothetical protein